MWNCHDEKHGIAIGYGFIPPFNSGLDRVLRRKWSRPIITFHRGSIHKLKELSKDEIIDFLYQSIHKSENLHLQQLKQEEKDCGYIFTPMYKNKPGYVYFMYAPDKRIMKIGCSSNPSRRRSAIARDVGCGVEIVAVFKSNAMYEHEHEMHQLFSLRHSHGEWYKIDPKHLKIVDRYLARKNKVAA